MVTLVDPDAVTPLASVTTNFSVNEPFTGCVTENDPVPEYGDVPPVADTVQLNGLPAVTPDDGQVTVTTSGWGATVTLAEPEAVTLLASVTLKVSVNLPFTG
jgi:hypothetical protein